MYITAGIVGFRGYSGAELVRLLRGHPNAEPVLLEHRSDSEGQIVPRGAKRPRQLPATADAVREAKLSVVFLATPPEVSMDITPGLLDAGTKVIDLSGAFRLRTAGLRGLWLGYCADLCRIRAWNPGARLGG